MEVAKKLIFNNIKPEDCVFGDSLGEGTTSKPGSNEWLLFRCVWKCKNWVAQEQPRQEVRDQDHEEKRYYTEQACISHRE